MSEQQRRKDLVAEYERTGTEAGVYRIVNTATGKALLGSSTNLRGVRNRFELGRTDPTALNPAIRADVGQFGPDAFQVEVVEVLERRPGATEAELKADLAELEALVREGIDPDLLY